MYHVELRQFPHNFCRFNLTEGELHETILDAWAQGEWIEVGERKWSPHQAKLIVLEGPELPVEQLSMGRGWSNASRQCKDVTEKMLEDARAGASASGGTPVAAAAISSSCVGSEEGQSSAEDGSASKDAEGGGSAPDVRLAVDSLGFEVLAQVGAEPVPLATVWRLARERYPERAASDCLELAEHAIRSLAAVRLAVVLVAKETGEQEPCGSIEQVEAALLSIDSWTGTGSSSALLRRA